MSSSIQAPGPGDLIHVVAPSGPVDDAALTRGLQVLTAMGLSPVTGKHVLERQGFLAGGDEARAGDLHEAFTDPRGGPVACARGGYGATRLLPLLDLEAMARKDRLLLGYSDATALGLALSRIRPQPQLYGPGIMELGATPPDHDEASFKAGLLGTHSGGRQTVTGLTTLLPGKVSAPILGGCLSLVAALAGTPYMPSLSGCILFLEDVNEEPYRLDRMLTQLSAAGVVEGILGLVMGSFTGCTPRAGAAGTTAAEVLAAWAASLSIPTISGLPAGHGPGRLTIPLGVTADLDAHGGTIVFHHQD
jgi:muramoyltetrapeptide carboxypeptidase